MSSETAPQESGDQQAPETTAPEKKTTAKLAITDESVIRLM